MLLCVFSDYRTYRRMDSFAVNLIAALGGTTKVSRLTDAPASTVQSWKKEGGLTPSRLNHLRMIADREGIAIDPETGKRIERSGPAMAEGDDSAAVAPSADNGSENICTGGEDGPGHPFGASRSRRSSPTSSPIPAPLRQPQDSPASSAGDEAVAA